MLFFTLQKNSNLFFILIKPTIYACTICTIILNLFIYFIQILAFAIFEMIIAKLIFVAEVRFSKLV